MTHRRLTPLALALLLAAGCGGGDGPTNPDPDPDPTASSLSISPSSASSSALDDTTDFSATVRDQDDNVMSNVPVGWASTDGSVVSVSGDGEAVAEAKGTAEVIASAEGLADTASVTVDQAADQVSVSPAVDTLTAGDSLQLSASAADANGNDVADADFAWSSSDTSVATVDSTGFVRTQSDGPVSVTAGLDDVTSAADLTVELASEPPPAGAPTVSSVSPSPVPEGGTVTISGSSFATTPDSNTVHVDGVEATVVAATSSSLDVDLPLYDCQPARDVYVSVTTSAGADSATAALEPDETPVQLAVGEQQLVEGPSSFCLQFGETTASERYVVGVQSLSEAPGSLTPVTVTAEAADGGGAALVDPVSLSAATDAVRAGEAPERSDRLEAHQRAEIERRRWERRNLDPRASLAARSSGRTLETSAIVGPGAQVGDTVSLRVPDGRTSDLCANYVEVGAVVKAVGTRGTFVADTANPAGGFTNADYQDFSDRLDDDVFNNLVDYMGAPTDQDGNGGVVVLISKAVNVTSPNALGFVWGGDLFPRSGSGGSSCAASDEGELYYGKAPDPDGDFGDPYAPAAALSQAPFVMAHELTHVIQQTRRFSAGQPWMSSIVAEAQATLAEEIVGHAVTSRSTGQNYGYATAFNAGGADEIDWYRDGFFDLTDYFGFETSTTRVQEAPDQCGWWREDSSPCTGRPLWYGVGWSFLRWASDHYGPGHPGGEQGFHRDLIGSGGTGPENVAAVLGQDFPQMMARWSAALYVDDRIGGADPLLGFTSWDLFDVEQNTVSTAHLQPLEQGFGDWQGVGEIRASSAGYIAVESAGRPATAIRVRGGSGGTLPSDMQVWVVRME